jgi:hypothetical protein
MDVSSPTDTEQTIAVFVFGVLGGVRVSTDVVQQKH